MSDEARDGWRNFCDEHGIDRAAFAEVIGYWLASSTGPLPEVVERWVREARDLRNQRRRRG